MTLRAGTLVRAKISFTKYADTFGEILGHAYKHEIYTIWWPKFNATENWHQDNFVIVKC